MKDSTSKTIFFHFLAEKRPLILEVNLQKATFYRYGIKRILNKFYL